MLKTLNISAPGAVAEIADYGFGSKNIISALPAPALSPVVIRHYLHDAANPGVRIGGVPQLVLVDVQTVLWNIRHLDAGGVRQHPQVLQ